MKKKKKNGGWFLAGLLGAVAGAVGGLLLAPESGKETQKKVISVAKKGKEIAKGKIKSLKKKKV